MRKRIVTLLTLAFLFFACVLLMPTKDGVDLLLSIYDAKSITYEMGTKNGSEISFIPTRYSALTTISQDIALSLSGLPDSTKNTGARLLHSPILTQSVTLPAANQCSIYASAQTFEQKYGAYAALKSSVPNGRQRWLYVLLHEQAHCLWNATLITENILLLEHRGTDIYRARQYFLAQYLGEAYADAYALAVLHNFDRINFDSTVERLANWRNATTTKSMPHRTSQTVTFAGNELNISRLQIKDFQETHAFAQKMALRGMYYWLLDQGVPEAAALEDMMSMQKITSTRYTERQLIAH